MKYRCLILDHDDTVVKSTPDIHYPSFVHALKEVRPDMKPLSLEEFIKYCFNPGFVSLCKDIMKFSKAEQDIQYKIWKDYTKSNIPKFYPGFADLLIDYKKIGGIISVVSHSENDQISRDYIYNCNIKPDLIFGWELDEDKRKPNSYPILETMKKYNLKENEILVIDDLKPGLDMARSCNVDFAGAGWSHIIPEISDYMKLNSDYYFTTVEYLKDFIFSC